MTNKGSSTTFSMGDQVVTLTVLRDELRRFAVRIILANTVVNAALLALCYLVL